MRLLRGSLVRCALFAALCVFASGECFAIAISSGSDTTAGLNGTADAIVRISDPGGSGSGTILKIQNFDGGQDLLVLTADHVVRNSAGGGVNLYAANQISIAFGNQGGGGASFAASAVATDFNIPQDGGSAVDLAMLDVFIPGSQLNTLPAGLTAVGLPAAQPAANSAITQAGYGLQASVATVDGNLAYVYSSVNHLGADYGTLKAGPNTINANGVQSLTGALSDYPFGVSGGVPDPGNVRYGYEGFSNGALINGAAAGYNMSTTYIFSGDSGGPSLSGNTILGVHSSSVTGTLTNDADAQVADTTTTDPNYIWKDVSVFDNLDWVNNELANLSPTPEPSSIALFAFGGALAALRLVRRARKR
jgi:hypothetical protein